MRFLITGCVGFIGFSIAQNLLHKKKNLVIGVDVISDYYSTSLKKKISNFKKK